jgi:hypothetical protein
MSEEKTVTLFEYELMAFLMVHGIKFKTMPSIDYDQKVLVGFIVKENAETNKLILDYFNNAPVPIKSYCAALKNLKDIMMGLVRAVKYGHCQHKASTSEDNDQ